MNFHTIDPLILQTLNLNQKRMNHILNILHGKPKRQTKKKYSFENSLRQDKNHSTLLPNITPQNHIISQLKSNQIYNTIDSKISNKKTLSLRQNQSNSSKNITKPIISQNPILNNQHIGNKISKSKTIDESIAPISLRNYSKQKHQHHPIKQPRNSLSAVRSKFHSHKNTPLSSPSKRELSQNLNYNQDSVILEESLINKASLKNSKKVKKHQMINDYMGQIGLKKSKSMILHPKDIYRLQIQKIVAELTPVEKLQDAEKKMKRIKRRHQNLKHFDQKYYSRLNQMDLVLL